MMAHKHYPGERVWVQQPDGSLRWEMTKESHLPRDWWDKVRTQVDALDMEARARGKLGSREAHQILVRTEGGRFLNMFADDDAVRARAKQNAEVCAWFCRVATGEANALGRIANYCEAMGVLPPQGQTAAGEIARAIEPGWWLRQLRKTANRQAEDSARRLFLVHGGRGGYRYVTDETVNAWRYRKASNRALLEQSTATNESGFETTLADLSDAGPANPSNRRNELMTRIAGVEQLARVLELDAWFLTVTCPSRFHACHSNGHPNAKYDDSTPRDGQAHLNRVWARTRAKLAREGIEVCGLRTAEPHRDGCPHWHLLAFVSADRAADLVDIFRAHALEESPDEPGAQEHRFTAKRIDPEKGSAAGYVAKYIAKFTDQRGLGDVDGGEPIETAERVAAWASVHGIRQYQFFGVRAVGAWRELRRLKAETDDRIEPARKAADLGDWAGFDIAASRCALRTAREWSDKPNRYGEPQGWRVFGVETGDGLTVVTRLHEWLIEWASLSRLRAEGQPLGLV
ncbi:MAG: replication endonuclease [Chromatiales bacterium]|nr:replication endonuclease [Gammaproteobacteria bacterium]MCP5352344.1 replication endonuclease [Chromatiales bacterium]